ncbi:MAG: hypothetical protein P8010_21935, partial [Desulfosarcinaceae bacterium]
MTIAQPYFFPSIRHGGLVTVLLMAMLLVFLFSLLFLLVGGITLAVNHFMPDLTAKVAAGLAAYITQIVHSKAGWLVAAALIVPAVVFSFFGRHLRPRRQAWTLLAIVLLLSLAVTGINVALSY